MRWQSVRVLISDGAFFRHLDGEMHYSWREIDQDPDPKHEDPHIDDLQDKTIQAYEINATLL